ncbi:YbaL family putative K(+) efflux transporter [Candidatus Pantoea edessiphila]|uniref:Kef family K(+) transporter n=1 Tax=Candidatus Pantoea edessiphila TaxID=2044610 RepID=A0A2P5SVG1_9GAMM|nr:YbaL family putative K(+) efflux transporter [Candidatus Pantoea edessiphila]PPI86316.1 Kef family K(+) transporter [Candidatus Pantoea edessiphila]
MHHSTPLINTIVGAFILAFVFGMIAHRLRISPLVGYLAAGVLAGPFTPGFVADINLIPELAELGVTLLMFGIGLHFSLRDLLEVKNIAIPGAVTQITMATIMGMGLSWAIGWPWATGLVFGLALSTASTVVLMRAFEERKLINTQRCQIAIGWLIVEDIVMILILVLLPTIASIVKEGDTSFNLLILDFLLTIGKVISFMALMMIVGRRAIPWMLAKSAATGSRELFTLAVLALALGIAFGAVKFFKISFALGAFFAGMTLNESELSHRAAHDTLPLRDAFAVLFFVSVGMLFNPMILIKQPIALLGSLIIILFGKSIVAWTLVILLGHSRKTALTISVSLAQIGEFAFILTGLGISLGLLSDEVGSIILATAILSIIINPMMFGLLEKYLNQNDENVKKQSLKEMNKEIKQIPVPVNISNHAVIIGYGRVGSIIGKKLNDLDIPLVVVENSHLMVELLKKQKINAVLGNATNEDIINLTYIDRARWLLLTIPNGYEAAEVVTIVRGKNQSIEIIARAHYDDEVKYIMERGANQVVMGEREIANSILHILKSDIEKHVSLAS